METVLIVFLFCCSIAASYFTAGYLAYNDCGKTSELSFTDNSMKGSIMPVVLLGGVLGTSTVVLLILIDAGIILMVMVVTVVIYFLFLFFQTVLVRYISFSDPKWTQRREWLSMIAATIVTLLYLIFPNWLTQDVVAMLTATGVLIVASRLTLKQIIILFCVVMMWDIYAVFKTDIMINTVETAIDLKIPLFVAVPVSASLLSKPLFIYGLGDIVLPGFLVMAAMREWRKRGMLLLPVATIGGYFCGYSLLLFIIFSTKTAQPATIYLIPAVTIAFFAAAWYRGIFSEMWRDSRTKYQTSP